MTSHLNESALNPIRELFIGATSSTISWMDDFKWVPQIPSRGNGSVYLTIQKHVVGMVRVTKFKSTCEHPINSLDSKPTWLRQKILDSNSPIQNALFLTILFFPIADNIFVPWCRLANSKHSIKSCMWRNNLVRRLQPSHSCIAKHKILKVTIHSLLPLLTHKEHMLSWYHTHNLS